MVPRPRLLFGVGAGPEANLSVSSCGTGRPGPVHAYPAVLSSSRRPDGFTVDLFLVASLLDLHARMNNGDTPVTLP